MNKDELLLYLWSFIEEARSRKEISSGLHEADVKTHIIRFQNEILQFLDYATNYLEASNPRKLKNTYYARPGYNQQIKSYLSDISRNQYRYSPSTKTWLKSFYADVKKNDFAISLLYPKAKHEKPHDIGLNLTLKVDVTNLSSVPDSELVKYDKDGATVGGGIRIGNNVSVSNSIVMSPFGAAIINSTETLKEFNGLILFPDYGVEVEYKTWADSCIKTCEEMLARLT